MYSGSPPAPQSPKGSAAPHPNSAAVRLPRGSCWRRFPIGARIPHVHVPQDASADCDASQLSCRWAHLVRMQRSGIRPGATPLCQSPSSRSSAYSEKKRLALLPPCRCSEIAVCFALRDYTVDGWAWLCRLCVFLHVTQRVPLPIRPRLGRRGTSKSRTPCLVLCMVHFQQHAQSRNLHIKHARQREMWPARGVWFSSLKPTYMYV